MLRTVFFALFLITFMNSCVNNAVGDPKVESTTSFPEAGLAVPVKKHDPEVTILKIHIVELQSKNKLKIERLQAYYDLYGSSNSSNSDVLESIRKANSKKYYPASEWDVNKLKKSILELTEISVKINGLLTPYHGGGRHVDIISEINGKVVGVEKDVLVINQGSLDGVQKGFVFSISRKGQFVTKAVVQEVHDERCVCYSDHDYDQLDEFGKVISVLKHDLVSTKPLEEYK